MRTIVRVLPRWVLLGVAGGALLVLAERAQDADAQTLDPIAAPTVPAVELPPVTTPPATTPPAPALPPAPELPPIAPPTIPIPAPTAPTTPAIPLDGVLGLSAAPAPAAPVPADALDRAPSVPVADPAPSRVELVETGELLPAIGVGFPPARAPPSDVPGSPHQCPGGGSPHPTC